MGTRVLTTSAGWIVGATVVTLAIDLLAQGASVVHRYDFERSSAADSVGAVDGALMGAATFPTDAPSGGKSILLDGGDQYIDFADPLEFGNEFSIATWVKPDGTALNIQAVVANAQGGWATDGFKLFFNEWYDANNPPDDEHQTHNGMVRLETGNGDGTGVVASTPEDALVLDSWNHVVTTIAIDSNGTTGEATTYVNGIAVVQQGPVVPDMNTNLPWAIGAMPARDAIGADWTWMGGIDDVQVYDGVLTDEEVTWLFEHPGEAIGFVPETRLGDVNRDDVVNGLDVDPFVDVLLNGPYQVEADMNEDGDVNGLDVDPFVAAVVGGGLAAVPEPSTLVLALGLAALAVAVAHCRRAD